MTPESLLSLNWPICFESGGRIAIECARPADAGKKWKATWVHGGPVDFGASIKYARTPEAALQLLWEDVVLIMRRERERGSIPAGSIFADWVEKYALSLDELHRQDQAATPAAGIWRPFDRDALDRPLVEVRGVRNCLERVIWSILHPDGKRTIKMGTAHFCTVYETYGVNLDGIGRYPIDSHTRWSRLLPVAEPHPCPELPAPSL